MMKSFESNFEQGGITFHVQGWEPDANPKAVVALVHGLGDHSGRYLHVGKTLTSAGYALIGFDLRGHGRSGGARGHFPSLEAVMGDIRQFFRLLSGRYPGVSQFLYGHSLGGLLVLAYTLQYGADLKGVIATGPGLRSALQEQKAKVAMVKMLGSLTPTTIIKSDLEVAAISHDPTVVQAYKDDPLVHDRVSLGFGKAGLSAVDLCFDRARGFKPPLLLMHGKADRITFPSGSEDFARLAGETNKDVTLKLWDGLYHEIHNEPEQGEVFKTMVEWLDGHL